MALRLTPTDILVDVNESRALKHIIERWALGNPYTHVRMYFGDGSDSRSFLSLKMPFPMFYESVGRGVIFTDVHHSFGQKVVVMGINPDIIDLGLNDTRDQVLSHAYDIATDPQSAYDYMSIPTFLIPRLICEKLGIPLPLKYQRNPIMVCSEAVAEPFWRAGLNVVSLDVEPLPGDFVLLSRYLVNKGTHVITADMF